MFHVLCSGHTGLKNVCRMRAGVKLLTVTYLTARVAGRRSRKTNFWLFDIPLRIEHRIASKMLARARVVSRALSATRGLSTTARILSNPTPPKPPPPIDDSTSALDYKTSHKVRPPPLPKMDLPRSRSAEEAVTNILYNTPPPSLQPYKK